jgi:hypothetical protein
MTLPDSIIEPDWDFDRVMAEVEPFLVVPTPRHEPWPPTE